MVLRVVLIGYGEIARQQHVPVLLSRSTYFELSAIVDPILAAEYTSDKLHAPAPLYSSLDKVMTSSPPDARLHVAVIACPPQFAQDYAESALEYNLSIFMEKPPGLDHRRLVALQSLAERKRLTMYTAYHSTAAGGVKRAREWADRHHVTDISIVWKESCAKWHPGQVWIAESRMGVLDTLINPISMVEGIVGPKRMASIKMLDDGDACYTSNEIVIPKNWSGPISGQIALVGDSDLTIKADFAWDYEADADIWIISFQSHDGLKMELYDGGAQVKIDGVSMAQAKTESDILRPEYEVLYDRFIELVAKKESEVWATPLRVMNDILENFLLRHGEEYSLA